MDQVHKLSIKNKLQKQIKLKIIINMSNQKPILYHREKSPQPIKSPSPDFLTKSIILTTKSPQTYELADRLTSKTPNKGRMSVIGQIEQLKKENQELKLIISKGGKHNETCKKLLQQIKLLQNEILDKDEKLKALKLSNHKVNPSKRISVTVSENSQLRDTIERKNYLEIQNSHLKSQLEKCMRQLDQSKRSQNAKLNQLENQNLILKNLINRPIYKQSQVQTQRLDMQLQIYRLQMQKMSFNTEELYDQLSKRLRQAQQKVLFLQDKLRLIQQRGHKREQSTNVKQQKQSYLVPQVSHYDTPQRSIDFEQIQKQRRKLQEYQRQLNGLKLNKHNLEDENLKLRSQISNVHKEINIHISQINKYANQNAFLRNQIDKINRPTDSMVKVANVETIKRLENQKDKLQFYLYNSNEQLQRQKQNHLISQHQIEALKGALENKKMRLSQSQYQKTLIIKELNELKFKFQEMHNSYVEINNQNDQLKYQVQNRATKTISDIQTITQLSNQLNKTRQQINNLISKCNKLEKQNKSLSKIPSVKDIIKKPSEKKIQTKPTQPITYSYQQQQLQHLKNYIKNLENQLDQSNQSKRYLERDITTLKANIINLQKLNQLLKRQSQAPSQIYTPSRTASFENSANRVQYLAQIQDLKKINRDLKAEIEQLKYEKNVGEKRNSILTHEITNLQKQIATLKDSKMKSSQILPSQIRVQSSEEKLENQPNKENLKLQKKNDDLSRQNYQLRKINDAIYKELVELKNKLNQQQNFLSNHEFIKTSLENEVKSLKQMLGQTHQQHIINEIEQLGYKNKQLEKSLVEKTNQVNKQRQKQFMADLQYKNVKQSYENLKQELFQMQLLKQSISKLKAQNLALINKNEELENDVKKLNSDYKNYKNETLQNIQSLKDYINNISNQLDNSKQSLNRAENQISSLKNDKQNLQKNISQHQNLIDSLNNQIKKLSKNHQNSENQMRKAQKQTFELKQVLQNLNLKKLIQLVKELKQNQRILLEQKITLIKSLSNFKIQVSMLKESNDLLKKQLLQLQSSYADLKQQHQLNLAIIQTLKTEIKTLEDKNSDLSHAINQYLNNTNISSINIQHMIAGSEVDIKLIESKLLYSREQQEQEIEVINETEKRINFVINRINEICSSKTQMFHHNEEDLLI